MAGDVFQKFKDSTNRTITKISVKTSSTLEKSKIRMHIDSLTMDTQDMLRDIGEEVYSMWQKEESASEILIEKLENVKQKKCEIEQLTIELDSIDERDNEILGNKVETTSQVTIAETKPHCPNCGWECESSAKFCRKCGTQL